jgi:hypothetical protein
MKYQIREYPTPWNDCEAITNSEYPRKERRIYIFVFI